MSDGEWQDMQGIGGGAQIRDVDERMLVTGIEILSPTKKRGTGREEYLRKRESILLSATHLVEIDLLARRGD